GQWGHHTAGLDHPALPCRWEVWKRLPGLREFARGTAIDGWVGGKSVYRHRGNDLVGVQARCRSAGRAPQISRSVMGGRRPGYQMDRPSTRRARLGPRVEPADDGAEGST